MLTWKWKTVPTDSLAHLFAPRLDRSLCFRVTLRDGHWSSGTEEQGEAVGLCRPCVRRRTQSEELYKKLIESRIQGAEQAPENVETSSRKSVGADALAAISRAWNDLRARRLAGE